MSVKKYLMKPTYVDAIQYLDDNLDEVIEFLGGVEDGHENEDGWIETPNMFIKDKDILIKDKGNVTLCIGDWITKSKTGKYKVYWDNFYDKFEQVTMYPNETLSVSTYMFNTWSLDESMDLFGTLRGAKIYVRWVEEGYNLGNLVNCILGKHELDKLVDRACSLYDGNTLKSSSTC